jgi:Ca2+/Na+ antiporter
LNNLKFGDYVGGTYPIEIKHTTDVLCALFLLLATSVVYFISIVGYISCVLYFYCWLHLLCALFLLLVTSVDVGGTYPIEIKHTTDVATNRNKAHNRCSQQ